MQRSTMLAGLMVVLTGCSDSATGGSDRTPATGRYEYTAEFTHWTGPVAVRATLTITDATPERIEGHWTPDPDAPSTVSGPIGVGTWNLDAYVVHGSASGSTARQSVNRIRRSGSATELECEGHMLAGSALEVRPGSCTLRYLGQ